MSNWVQYEVWSEDGDGQSEIIETTASKKDALRIAERTHKETNAIVTVYEETTDGDYQLIKEFS
jgi:hypothetical protein